MIKIYTIIDLIGNEDLILTSTVSTVVMPLKDLIVRDYFYLDVGELIMLTKLAARLRVFLLTIMTSIQPRKNLLLKQPFLHMV